ncbi:hypothetical protein GWI33_007167 [Rhynchophorus ferrugineus]|uniref:Inter-alpha-trypsin inhibitor heavy chain H4 n=1 Tax=Rhynchophorus ferrugineus TaxID=354439 RepID=A0A834IY64_RHYFE|nr:hypothetical protein GWI33_007167 [Rhynchophorus ferrugineus]
MNESGVPQIYEMLLHTNVSNRYAKTLITSKVKNQNTYAQETTFSIVMPDKAFISSFTMEIDGKKYEAFVQEKAEAKKTYDRAVASGVGAAHVAASARDSNRFTVSVNIEPQCKATFYLQYEELLVRKTEKYELVLNINPGQLIKKLAVVVNITESRPLSFVKVPSLRSGNELTKNDENADPEADIQVVNDLTAIVTFKPDVVKQKLLIGILGGKEDDGMSGQFIIQYDVARDPLGGEVLVDGGYFVHFFAPKDLTPLNKQILFVLDTSGSMYGRNMQQLKEAMKSILDELREEDTFSIIDFNSVVSVWNIEQVNIEYQDRAPYYSARKKLTVLPNSFPVSRENVKKAKRVVQKLVADGGTDIERGLKVALEIVNKFFNSKGNHPIIVFLTDGQATYGTTEEITFKITQQNEHKVPIYALSFGSGADKEFLQKISLKNQGFSRHIYEAADASLQLRNFYQEISSPLLTDVIFKYVNKVKNVTRTQFPILFKGGELCTAGITEDGFVPTIVEAFGGGGPIALRPRMYQSAGSLERLWAYLTVRQLLEQRQVARDKESITAKALSIALKYSFVTDITSLVVVKPNVTSTLELEDASSSSRTSPPLNFGPQYLQVPVSTVPPLDPFGGRQEDYFEPLSAGRSYNIFDRTRSRDLIEAVPESFDFDETDFGLLSFRTTSSIPSTSETPSWIQSVLNNNETLSINGKYYILGLNKTLGEGQECSNSVNNSTGHCTLLHECPNVHGNLTDLETYKKYFCEQKSYAACRRLITNRYLNGVKWTSFIFKSRRQIGGSGGFFNRNQNVIPQIYEMLLHTNVSNRYAKTLVTSKVKNQSPYAQETTFSLVIPDKAFISGFTMEIDGKEYEAFVQEKVEAKRTYDRAVASGIGAAHVAASVRDSNRFTVSINIEPQSKAIFRLQYEELLVRKTENYELVLNINPGQLITKLAVMVNIIESRPLRFVKIPSLRSGNELTMNDEKADLEADIDVVNDTSVIITFEPSIEEQKLLTRRLGREEGIGLSGQLIVQYDVVRDPLGGEVLVDGGYFVHFFAPEDLTPLNKQVLFVLDTSGSMYGRKINQLKEAMKSILDELKEEDTFSIIDFNTVISVWNIEQVNIDYLEGLGYGSSYFPIGKNLTVLPNSFPASRRNVQKAKRVIDKLETSGRTDIERGLKVALETVNKFFRPNGNYPMIVFLTDGRPTYGIIEEITSIITKQNVHKVPIYALSFGSSADKEFLEKLSLKNQGFSRHIYEAADASLQLRNFYQEISSPLLADVRFKYVNKVKHVTRTQFPNLFKGGELCTAGMIEEGFMVPDVQAINYRGLVSYRPKMYQSVGSLERLWAYLTVKQLLEQRQVATDKEYITAKALSLALKYSFVTDITSLVVVKPNVISILELEDASVMDPHFSNKGREFTIRPEMTAAPIDYDRIEPPLLTSSGNFSWIEGVLHNNETLFINAKYYTLGLNEKFGEGQECSNSVNNSSGRCTLLHECPNVHDYLTDFQTYKKYFCKRRKYAGVCCPTLKQ